MPAQDLLVLNEKSDAAAAAATTALHLSSLTQLLLLLGATVVALADPGDALALAFAARYACLCVGIAVSPAVGDWLRQAQEVSGPSPAHEHPPPLFTLDCAIRLYGPSRSPRNAWPVARSATR